MRILVVETASPKRIFHKVEEILKSGAYPDPKIVILCREDHRHIFSGLSGVEICTIAFHEAYRSLKKINEKKFNIALAFWTGEKGYRWMKLLILRLKAEKILVAGGDGNEFRLTWKAICRHAIFRRKHPFPTDHHSFLPAERASERVLIIQSAEPPYVLKALDRLRDKPQFRDARYTLFCRNKPEVVKSFQCHPMLSRVLTHSESRGSWKHLKDLRKLDFDAIVLFLTGDPSYRKVKLFSFLLGVPWDRMLIFNEASDSFFFNWIQCGALISHRIQAQPHAKAGPRLSPQIHALLSLAIKTGLLPFRFVWLLLVWLRLRLFAHISLRKKGVYSLQLPPFSGA